MEYPDDARQERRTALRRRSLNRHSFPQNPFPHPRAKALLRHNVDPRSEEVPQIHQQGPKVEQASASTHPHDEVDIAFAILVATSDRPKNANLRGAVLLGEPENVLAMVFQGSGGRHGGIRMNDTLRYHARAHAAGCSPDADHAVRLLALSFATLIPSARPVLAGFAGARLCRVPAQTIRFRGSGPTACLNRFTVSLSGPRALAAAVALPTPHELAREPYHHRTLLALA